MAYTLKTRLCNKRNYTAANRNIDDIDYIVIHYTGNDGDTDENNGNYFANNSVGASAHYFVDDDSVTMSVEPKNIAWHCGDRVYYHSKCRNSNSIGIEICDDVRNGSVYPSAKTIENVVAFTKSLMKKYNIPPENVIRHYDVTHKVCPGYWCGSASKDKKWKSEFWNKLSDTASDNDTSSDTLSDTSNVSTNTSNKSEVVKVKVVMQQIYKGNKSNRKGQVLTLQRVLNELKEGKGYPGKDGKKLTLDGDFGANTDYALREFQKVHKLEVDGICGQKTWNELLCAVP